MFADAIKSTIHPATWAVLGIKRDALGTQIAHRGTAFAVDNDGHLLTCWHVTYMDEGCTLECDEFIVAQPDLNPAQYGAKLVARERNRDVALLKIAGGVRTKYVGLVDSTVPLGRSCCALGHPLSVTDPSTMSMRIFTRAAAGIVSTPYSSPRFPGTPLIKLYEVDFFTHGGASGGPLFLRNGTVFGFVSGSHLIDDGKGNKTRSNLSVCIDIREAIEFLKPLNINLQIHRRVK